MADPPAEGSPPQTADTAAPFNTEPVLSRLGRRLELEEDARLLEFGVRGASAAVQLARDIGCRITVADASPEALDRVRGEADEAGVRELLTLLPLGHQATSLPEATFDLAIAGQRVASLGPLAAQLRPTLLPSRGRLVAVVAARVGVARADLARWEEALGGPLRLPQAELAELMRAGFEPEWAEALGEAELVQLYGAGPAPAAEEAALVEVGPSGLSFLLVAGRRREPDEVPPAARDRG